MITDWHRFLVAVQHAGCGVLVLPDLAQHRGRDRLRQARSVAASVPVVLVTRADAENLRSVCDIPVDAVVWLHDVDRALWPAVEQVRRRDALYEVAQQVESAGHLPPQLRHALLHLCRSRNPAYTVNGLAALVGCCRQTLWEQCMRNAGGGEKSPKDAVGCVLLLRALRERQSGASWETIARRLGVSLDRLQRMAARLAHGTLGELEATAPERLTAWAGALLLGLPEPQMVREKRRLPPPT